MDEKNLAKLQKLFDAMDNESFTKKDALAFFQNVVNKVLEIQKNNLQEIEALKVAYKQVQDKLQNDHITSITDLKKQTNELFVGQQVEKMRGEHSQRIMTLDERIARIRDGKDGIGIQGVKGDKGDRGSPDSPIEVRDKLELLQGKARLSKDAIDGLNEILDEFKKKRTLGGGGFSAMALNSHILDPYVPTGTVNGVNTDFSLSTRPIPDTSLKVYRGGQLQSLTEDYTLSGNTITFLVAPVVGEIIKVEHRS